MPEQRPEASEQTLEPEARNVVRREQEAEPLGAGCAVRLAWLVAGPLAVAFSAAMLARHETSNPWVVGAVFWGAVVTMVALRYWDVTQLDGRTSNGEPATLAHFKRYSLTVAAVSAALFGFALLIRG
jgi:hypothetical protein